MTTTNTYPKWVDGNQVWACCLSVADCNHKRAQEGRPIGQYWCGDHLTTIRECGCKI